MMRTLLSCAVLLALVTVVLAQDKKEEKPEDTTKAAKTRELLKKKISIEWKDTQFRDVVEELKTEVKGLIILVDTKSGVSMNKKFSYSAKDKTVEEILNDICKDGDFGYYVISNKANTRDGAVNVRKSDERGYEKKK